MATRLLIEVGAAGKTPGANQDTNVGGGGKEEEEGEVNVITCSCCWRFVLYGCCYPSTRRPITDES